MTALFNDDYNRANENPLAGNWSTQNGEAQMDLVSNAATNHGDTTDQAANVNSVTPPNDQYAKAKITASTGFTQGDGPGVATRMATAAKTYYRAVMRTGTSNNCQVGKKVGGAYTNLGDRNLTYSAGTEFYLESQGSTHIVKYGGVQLGLSINDGAITSGRFGISYSSENAGQSCTIDDFEGGDFSGAGGGTKAIPLFKRPTRVWVRRVG